MSFLNSLLGQISLAALTKGHKQQEEAYTNQVSIVMYTAFILGLRGGNLPPATSATDEVVIASNVVTSVQPRPSARHTPRPVTATPRSTSERATGVRKAWICTAICKLCFSPIRFYLASV